MELRRQHSGDAETLAQHAHRLPERVGIRPKVTLPVRIADDHRARAARLLLLGREQPPSHRFHAEDLKQLRHHLGHVRVLGRRAGHHGRGIVLVIRHGLERRALIVPIVEVRRGYLPVEGGTVEVAMPPFGTVTLVVRTGSPAPATADPVAPAEPAQPVHTRYWLHGKGPAPAGNLPVAVHLSPTRIALPHPGEPAGGDSAGGEPAALTLTVGCGAEPVSGTAELSAPGGISVTADRDLAYDLAPGGYAAWDLTVRAAPGTAAGRYFVAARIRDQFGHLTEDTVMVAVGEPRWPDPDLDRK